MKYNKLKEALSRASKSYRILATRAKLAATKPGKKNYNRIKNLTFRAIKAREVVPQNPGRKLLRALSEPERVSRYRKNLIKLLKKRRDKGVDEGLSGASKAYRKASRIIDYKAATNLTKFKNYDKVRKKLLKLQKVVPQSLEGKLRRELDYDKRMDRGEKRFKQLKRRLGEGKTTGGSAIETGLRVGKVDEPGKRKTNRISSRIKVRHGLEGVKRYLGAVQLAKRQREKQDEAMSGAARGYKQQYRASFNTADYSKIGKLINKSGKTRALIPQKRERVRARGDRDYERLEINRTLRRMEKRAKKYGYPGEANEGLSGASRSYMKSIRDMDKLIKNTQSKDFDDIYDFTNPIKPKIIPSKPYKKYLKILRTKTKLRKLVPQSDERNKKRLGEVFSGATRAFKKHDKAYKNWEAKASVYRKPLYIKFAMKAADKAEELEKIVPQSSDRKFFRKAHYRKRAKRYHRSIDKKIRKLIDNE